MIGDGWWLGLNLPKVRQASHPMFPSGSVLVLWTWKFKGHFEAPTICKSWRLGPDPRVLKLNLLSIPKSRDQALERAAEPPGEDPAPRGTAGPPGEAHVPRAASKPHEEARVLNLGKRGVHPLDLCWHPYFESQ